MAKRKTDEEYTDMLTTVRIEREELDISQSTIQQMPNGGTRVFCSFIGAGESVITLEIAGAAGNPKRGRRWYGPVKGSVEYVIQNWWLLVFVWDKFRGM